MANLSIKNFPDGLYRQLQKRARKHRRSLAQEVREILAAAVEKPATHSILELQGLGKELWKGIDAAKHVAAERDSWD